MENKDLDSPQPQRLRNRSPRNRRSPLAIIFPLLFFTVFAGVIAWREFPLVRNWFDKTYRAEHWKLRHACEQAGLDGAAQPEYARIIEVGQVNKTQDGYFVDQVMVGEMGQDGAEQKIQVSCYLDADGQLIKSHREPWSRPRQPEPSAHDDWDDT